MVNFYSSRRFKSSRKCSEMFQVILTSIAAGNFRCDRILWLGRGIKQLSYNRGEIKLSDHRPVSSLFSVEVEVLDHRKLQRAINFTSAVVHPELLLDEDDEL